MGAPGPRGPAAGRRAELLSRVVRLRRRRHARDTAAEPSPTADEERIRVLERRLDHLEALLEGLQDAIHRDSVRHEGRVAELEKKVKPAEISRALSRDAYERGI